MNELEPQQEKDDAVAQSGLNAWLGAWLPIETAPHDGSTILVFAERYAIDIKATAIVKIKTYFTHSPFLKTDL